MCIPEGLAHDAPSHLRPEVVGVVKAIDPSHHVLASQARVLDVRKLVAVAIRQGLSLQEVSFDQVIVEFRSGKGVGQRNLDGLAVELFGEVDGALDGFLGFAGQADNEVAVNGNAHLLAVFRERASHFDRGAFLDVLQDLRITGLEADDEQARAAIGHGLQGFVVAVHPGVGRPAELERLEFLANLQYPVLADVEGIVVKEKLFHLRKHLECLLDFARHVVGRPHPPGMTGDRLRPLAEGA